MNQLARAVARVAELVHRVQIVWTTSVIHLPFENRLEAGRALASELRARRLDANAIVLALPRGGVPVGFEVADRLSLPLDVVVARKIGVPWQPELAMGALAGDVLLLDHEVVNGLGVPEDQLREVIADEQREARRRESLYRIGAAPLDVLNRKVILIDDGLATGNTMTAAVRYVKSRRPEKILVAVPVAAREALARLGREADQTVAIAVPDPFYAVGEWYREFPQVSDEAVRSLLSANLRNQRLQRSGAGSDCALPPEHKAQ